MKTPAAFFNEILHYSPQDSREVWFHRVARLTGLSKTRVRSLFYNPKCRLLADELVCIERAIAQQSKNLSHEADVQFSRALSLSQRQKELSNEQIEALYGLALQVVKVFGHHHPDSC